MEQWNCLKRSLQLLICLVTYSGCLYSDTPGFFFSFIFFNFCIHFVSAEADTQKNRYASAKTSNAALVNLLIESLKMILWLIVFCFFVQLFYKNKLYKNTEAHITKRLRTIKKQWPGWMQGHKKTSRVRNR